MSPNITRQWAQDVSAYVGKVRASTPAMPAANADMIRRVLRGMGPDKNLVDPACGARVVMNIAAVHVPNFCSEKGRAYKNAYDLGKLKAPRQGDPVSASDVPVRALVDTILCSVTNGLPDEIYFGAVEVNGSGIRFYGDICLVLRTDVVNGETVVLDRNSYDLVRPPNTAAGTQPSKTKLQSQVQTMAGLWSTDTPEMSVLKVFSLLEVGERRLTTGQISEAVLDDEDYIEVLKIGSFDVGALQEARVSAADAAAEAQVGAQLQMGPCPNLAELEWRKHRRAAVKALQAQQIRTRVVTTSGRVRT